MRRAEIRNALDEVAGRELGPPRDLWPGVRRAVVARRRGAGRIVVEATGRRAARLGPAAALLALVIAAVVFGPALLPGGPPGTAATPTALAGPSPLPRATAPPQATALSQASATPDAARSGNATNPYGRLLQMSLAKRLGIDPVALDAAFQAAASATIAQAVRDGALTPAQAAQAQTQAGQGLAALLAQGFAAQGTGVAAPDMNALLDAWLATLGVATPTAGATK